MDTLAGGINLFLKEVKYLECASIKKTHLELPTGQSRLSFWTLKMICVKSWGNSPKIICWIYQSVVKPMVK